MGQVVYTAMVLRARRNDRRRDRVPARGEQLSLDRRQRPVGALAAGAGGEARARRVGQDLDRPARERRGAGPEEPGDPWSESCGRARRGRPWASSAGSGSRSRGFTISTAWRWSYPAPGIPASSDTSSSAIRKTAGPCSTRSCRRGSRTASPRSAWERSTWSASRPDSSLRVASSAIRPIRSRPGSGSRCRSRPRPTTSFGREALERRKAHPGRKLVGLDLEGKLVPSTGDCVRVGRAQVGEITSAVRSPILGRVIALCRIDVVHAELGLRGRSRATGRPSEAHSGAGRGLPALRSEEATRSWRLRLC